MVTLNELLEITEVEKITLYVPLTSRIDTRLDFEASDRAILDEVTEMYGAYRVKRISPVFAGDPRMVVKLARPLPE